MKKISKGILAVMVLSSGFLTGCATTDGGRSSGAYNLSQSEAGGGGNIFRYQPVSHTERKATQPKFASACSS